MNKNTNKVFDVPQINAYKDYTLRIFNNKNEKYNLIYLVKFNTKKNIGIPNDILKFYKLNIIDHVDGDIVYLPRALNSVESCIVMYGRNKYRNINKYLGSLISSKIKNKSWKLYNNIASTKEYDFYLGWGLGQYKFNNLNLVKSIYINNNTRITELISTVSGICFGKELINMPSSDMRPDDLEESFVNFANHHKLNYKILKNNIIKDSFPLLHAVGKGSTTEPRLLELYNYKNKKYPLVIIVGKGVCYDTGGLDLKPSQYMRNMKKDMGGAASAISLANIVIATNLKVNLMVLIPAVDNDIGPNAMRPGDVFKSRSGITVEIGNTDAEGRLILADTLHYADSFKPNLLIDFATLTGAARVALGADLPAYFTNNDSIASLINNISLKENDPLWRLPLWMPYMDELHSDTADLNNISKGPFAGAIIGGLFLNKFVNKKTNWLHIDTYAWNNKGGPGHTSGADILGVRSIYKVIKNYINNL